MPYTFSKCENNECINKPENYDDLLEMAKLGNSAIKAAGGKEYDLVSCLACRMHADGYSGASIDWTQAVAKIPFSFGLELPPAPPSVMPPGLEGLMLFHLREDRIIQTGKEVWAFHQAIAEKIIKA